MKTLFINKTASTALALLVATGAFAVPMQMAMAEGQKVGQAVKAPQQNKDHQTSQHKKAHNDKAAAKRKEIVSEAVTAIRETQNALKALDNGKAKDALKALEVATGKLQVILARDPKLALAPLAVNTVTHDVLVDVTAVKVLKKAALFALQKGQLQTARRLIRDLASETVIKVANIPLVTYPAAIKEAVKRIDAGKTEEAKMVLQSALDTLVVTETIIPLPVVSAEYLLVSAEKLAKQKKRTDKDNAALTKLLVAADKELKLAEALGYGTAKDFKNLYAEMDKIRAKTSDGKSGTGFFAKIKGFLKDAIGSSQKK